MLDLEIRLIKGRGGSTFLRMTYNTESTYIPIDLKSLEISSDVLRSIDEVANQQLCLNAWSNPEIKFTPINNTEAFLLSYYLILSFLQIRDTRDMWVTLPNINNKMISYIKERSMFSQHLVPYKVAFLTCIYHGYRYSDLNKIERVFESCGLEARNSVFYLVFLASGDVRDLKITNEEPYCLNLRVLNAEIEEFGANSNLTRLCHHQTRTKLAFIVKANNIDYGDMATELLMNTIVAYRIARPQNSRAYSENYARRSMTNTAIRIIYAHTHYDRNIRLWKEGDRFVGREYNIMDDQTICPSSTASMDYSAYNSSVLFNEDVFLDAIDARRAHNAEAAA